MNKMIWITFQKEGIHKYPAALEDPKLSDVSFLGYPHRHIFHFKVSIEVFHDDRDLEFILLKRELEGLYESGTLQLNYKSCEMMAEDLYEYIGKKYPARRTIIEISEDNENGCVMEADDDMWYEENMPDLAKWNIKNNPDSLGNISVYFWYDEEKNDIVHDGWVRYRNATDPKVREEILNSIESNGNSNNISELLEKNRQIKKRQELIKEDEAISKLCNECIELQKSIERIKDKKLFPFVILYGDDRFIQLLTEGGTPNEIKLATKIKEAIIALKLKE